MSDTPNLYLFGYCQYTGTPDLYPKKYRDLINNHYSNQMIIKIQRWWRQITRKQIYKLRLEKNQNNISERLASWFGF